MNSRYSSPLRYPGGKARLAPFFARLLEEQPDPPSIYAEPFAGGAGAALQLLFEERVSRVMINDLNPGIAAFWRAVTEHSDEFAEIVEKMEVTLDTWSWARDTYASRGSALSDLDLGMATFFLNRCNRSGILHARPIGGMRQDGKWKIDARFNRTALAQRIRRIGDYRTRISVSELNAIDFIAKVDDLDPAEVLMYVDPPYLGQGDALYMNSLSLPDHEALAVSLNASRARWVLTYDADDRVTSSLYTGLRCLEFRIAHTAARQHVGVELAVFSRGLRVPSSEILPSAEAEWIVA